MHQVVENGSAGWVRDFRARRRGPSWLTTSHHPRACPNALPLRPDDLLAFRLGRLVLLLDTVPGLPSPKPMDVERISLYDFFADNPFLVFGRETAGARNARAGGLRLSQPLLPVVGAALLVAPRAPAARPRDAHRLRAGLRHHRGPSGRLLPDRCGTWTRGLAPVALRAGVPIERRARGSGAEPALRSRAAGADPRRGCGRTSCSSTCSSPSRSAARRPS